MIIWCQVKQKCKPTYNFLLHCSSGQTIIKGIICHLKYPRYVQYSQGNHQ